MPISTSEHVLVSLTPAQEVITKKNEYSIVSDRFYVGFSNTAAPDWLQDLVNNIVGNVVSGSLTNYASLTQDVRNAIDSIDIAANTYVETINFSSLVDGIVGTHIATLNATYEGVYATIVDLDVVVANANEALTLRANDLQASFSTEIDSRITGVQLAYAAADAALANDITTLTTAFADQELQLAGFAEAITGLQTYVGLDYSTGNPNGLGILARLDTLEKQTDGKIEFISNTYDVMLGVEDPNNNTDNDQLITDALPYVLWTEMAGTGVPISTTRSYMDYSLETLSSATTNILEGTLYVRSDFTDVNVDKYYEFSSGSWSAVTEATYNLKKEMLRRSHIGDVYIRYESVNGTRNYLRSYKFIKAEPDLTSPFATDAEGYTWSLVTDTDSQAIYTIALQARDMADGKISHFYAWGGTNQPADYDVILKPEVIDPDDGITVLQAEVKETVSAENFIFWFKIDNKLYHNTGTPTSQVWVEVPTVSGNGVFVEKGDLLTVFDPINNDTTTYWFNGTSWVVNGPTGIISKSKWFVDLDNAVHSPNGSVATAMADLKVTSEAYADEASLAVENKFSYNSVLKLPDGKYYNSGFGLDSSGVTQTTDGLTPQTAYDSEFWVNAERFVLKSPSYPGIEASFKITPIGIVLGVENTEATRNVPVGVYTENTSFKSGDIVSFEGRSFIAKQDVPDTLNDLYNTAYWQLLADKGESGNAANYFFTRKASTPTDPDGADTWYDLVTDVPAGAGSLWSIKATTDNNNVTTYSDKRIIDAPIVRELTIYSVQTTAGSFAVPTGSTYNFTNDSLSINHGSWSRNVPTSVSNNYRIFVTTALVTGNNTQTAVSITWNTSVVYIYRQDGTSITGPAGRGISSIVNNYRLGTSATNQDAGYPSSTWHSTVAGAGSLSVTYPYLWKRYVIYYTDNTNSGYIYELIGARGSNGDDGEPGVGTQGSRGSAVATYTISATTLQPNSISSATLASYWNSAVAAEYQNEISGDTLVITNPHSTSGWTHIFKYNGSSWASSVAFTVNGDAIVDGTIVSDHLATGSVTTGKVSASAVITAGTGNNIAALNGSDATWRMYAGNANPASAPFRVDKNGVMYATAGSFSGDISGATGTFSGVVTGASFNGMRFKIGTFYSAVDTDQTVFLSSTEGRVYNTSGGYSVVGGITPAFSVLVGVSVTHMAGSYVLRDANMPRVVSNGSFTFNRDDGFTGSHVFSYIAWGY